MAKYKKFDFKKLYFILYITLILIFVYLIFKLGIFLLPFVIGLLISMLLQPFSMFLEKKIKLSHKVATIVSIVLFIIVFVAIIIISSLKLIEEIYNLSQNLEYYSTQSKILWNNFIDNFYSYLGYFPKGLTNTVKENINNFISMGTRQFGIFINKTISVITSIPTIILYICITILSTFFISLDKTKIVDFLSQQFPDIWLEKIYAIKKEMFSVLGSYIRAQLILMTICFVELLVSLNLLSFFKFNVKYPLIMSILICVIDALPILGAGAILLPWAVLSLFLGNIPLAIALFIIYLAVLSVRQFLEPKLISQNIGVHPLITLISMYSGFKILGVTGFLVGPVVMIILKNVFSNELEVGFFKEMFNDTEDTDKKNNNDDYKSDNNNNNIEDFTKNIKEKYKEFIETKKG